MYIGIDLGTSSVKMILTDTNQNIIATANSGLTVQSPKDGTATYLVVIRSCCPKWWQHKVLLWLTLSESKLQNPNR